MIFGNLFLIVAPFWRKYRLLVDPNEIRTHITSVEIEQECIPPDLINLFDH